MGNAEYMGSASSSPANHRRLLQTQTNNPLTTDSYDYSSSQPAPPCLIPAAKTNVIVLPVVARITAHAKVVAANLVQIVLKVANVPARRSVRRHVASPANAVHR